LPNRLKHILTCESPASGVSLEKTR
jgi:hypothetical protein